jgi:lipopolysaccharide export system protein LptA
MTPLLRSIAFGSLLLTSGSLAAQSLDHDSDQPIEITADSLEVLQEERIATFAGNVDAVQGDLVLSADQLRVLYDGQEEDAAEAAGAGLAAGTSGTIRRIEAEGRVFMTSPEETAEGDVGVYDVPARLVTLEGSVVLTRGENVIRGDRLELDLATGKSRMLAAGADLDTGDGDGRVRALFTPKRASSAEPPSGDAAAVPPTVPSSAPPLPEAKPK